MRMMAIAGVGVLVALAMPLGAAQLVTADAAVAAFKQAAPGATETNLAKTTFFVVRDSSNNVAKVAYLKVAQGYKGKITLFAVAKNEGGTVVFEAIQVVEGKDKYKECTNGQEGNYMKQFAGKPADKETKEMKLAADSISGASVTARSIKRAIDGERANLAALFGIRK